MIVFVTGATGVVGRPAVRRLLAAGHHVRAAVRDESRAAVAAAAGAEPVVVDLFDEDATASAVAGADVVAHLATRIPVISRARRRSAWAENDRLRSETTRALVEGSLAHGVERVVAESITFPYVDRGAEWIDEEVDFDPGVALGSVVDLEREVARFAAGGGSGIALRFGAFYGSDARAVDEFLGLARRRVAPTLGRAGAYLSSIHTEDAGAAVATAVDAPLGSGAYNVVDDRPVTRRELADVFAEAFGLPGLRLVPTPIARVLGGRSVAPLLRSQRVSNRRFREATGWAPTHTDVVAGWPAVARSRAGDAEDDRARAHLEGEEVGRDGPG